MAVRIGINGFGRIGRSIVRCAQRHKVEGIEFVAVNDITDAATLAHLLKHDSILGAYPGEVKAEGNALRVDRWSIAVLSEREPEKLPWRDLRADVVFEATGLFRDREKAAAHLRAGAKKVIITAPGKKEDITIALGVNEGMYDPARHHVISNASCTTNCLAPVAKVLLERFGIARGLMTTIHAYTNDQRLLDLPHKDLRRARAAALSMIPTTTGAARAVGLVLPALAGKIDGMAIRVPTPNVSLVDFVAELEREADVGAVNAALREASAGPLKGILAVCDEPLVSIDFNGDPHSAIVDAASTAVIGGHLAKVLAWYDNEWAYSLRCLELAMLVGSRL